MTSYVAFLRGVSPLNAKMPELRHAFEQAGFGEVKTVLASGNVVFSAHSEDVSLLARQAEAAMAEHLGRTFYTIVRPVSALRDLVESDPFRAYDLPTNTKRIVTFVGQPRATNATLPVEASGVRILALYGQDVLTAYVPDQADTRVLPLIEKMFGTHVTTRTWETVKKCANG